MLHTVAALVRAVGYFCSKWVVVLGALLLMQKVVDTPQYREWEVVVMLLVITLAAMFWFCQFTLQQWDNLRVVIKKDKV